ncbi:MAG: hypothetical protein WD554_07760 [Flavobacteriaceae bacterium]
MSSLKLQINFKSFATFIKAWAYHQRWQAGSASFFEAGCCEVANFAEHSILLLIERFGSAIADGRDI